MGKEIIIKKNYFDSINSAIDSINDFFGSNFAHKDFPVLDETDSLDSSVANILSWLNNIEPSWIDNSDKVDAIVERLKESEEPDTHELYAYIGYKFLQLIADNFDKFSNILNGIYTFELFTKPSKYVNDLDVFSKPLDLSEVNVSDQFCLITSAKYVHGIMHNNALIKLPKLKSEEEQIERINEGEDLTDVEIVIDDSEEDDEIQEATEVNAFENFKMHDITYDAKNDKFKLSKEFSYMIDQIISKLRSYDDSKSLREYLNSKEAFNLSAKTIIPELMGVNQIPFILTKVYTNEKKYPFEYNDSELVKYMDSYKSIKTRNKGAERFFNYDLYTTFKADKEGTIKFIEDFLKCEFYNNPNANIPNNRILTIFNIFDSRIYFDKLFYMIPEKIRNTKYPAEDGFVKQFRARLNKNSRNANLYDHEEKEEEPTKTSEVMEFVYKRLRELGDIDFEDIQNIDMIQELCYRELECVGDLIYNEGLSQIAIDRIVGESYNFIQELEMGDIPDYMKERIDVSDKTPDDVTTTQTELPPDEVPTNSYDDLATSIDNKINSYDGDDPNALLGTGYEERKSASDGKIVYNITNNITYNNSFNKNSNNQSTDNSQGKTVNITNTNSNNNSNNDSSHTSFDGKQELQKHHPIHDESKINNDTPNKSESNNNSNNSSQAVSDTNTSNDENVPTTGEQKIDWDKVSEEMDQLESQLKKPGFLSNGMSVKECYTLLEASEPLSDNVDTMNQNSQTQAEMPSETASTKMKDFEKKVGKAGNTVVQAGKLVAKPFVKVKQWLTTVIDSLNKRDENQVKREIIESKSYRQVLYKATRIAIRLGLISVAFTITSWLGVVVVAVIGAREYDKHERLKKEVYEEWRTEIKILNDKIELANRDDTPEARRAKWKMMRMRSKMYSYMTNAAKSKVKIPTDVQ